MCAYACFEDTDQSLRQKRTVVFLPLKVDLTGNSSLEGVAEHANG